MAECTHPAGGSGQVSGHRAGLLYRGNAFLSGDSGDSGDALISLGFFVPTLSPLVALSGDKSFRDSPGPCGLA